MSLCVKCKNVSRRHLRNCPSSYINTKIKHASGLLGGKGIRRITSPGENCFNGCQGGKQSANSRARGRHQNPGTESCGKRDRVREVWHGFLICPSFTFMWVLWLVLIVYNKICMCRIKERARRAGALRKEEESERRSLQVHSSKHTV